MRLSLRHGAPDFLDGVVETRLVHADIIPQFLAAVTCRPAEDDRLRLLVALEAGQKLAEGRSALHAKKIRQQATTRKTGAGQIVGIRLNPCRTEKLVRRLTHKPLDAEQGPILPEFDGKCRS